MTIIIDDLGETEGTSPMKDEGNNDGGVPALKGVAVVHEGLISKGRNGKTLLFEARENPSNKELEEEKPRIYFPRVKIGTGIL